MKKIKINFEYKAFPIWVYDEQGILLMNDSPAEILNNKKIDDKLIALQQEYNALFIDDGKIFKYVGFKSELEKIKFSKKIEEVIAEIEKNVGEKYIIEQTKRVL